MITDVLALPTGVLVALGILAVAALVLDAIALIDLYRRPAGLIVFGKKWIWLVLILFLNVLGPVLYLLTGRKADSPTETPAPVRANLTGAADAVDKLYGPPDHPSRR
ncbi:MAG TPA: PLD nuclease N-terminal domain-containing protein [Arthrobacter sp.]